jgi:hypothetical protein
MKYLSILRKSLYLLFVLCFHFLLSCTPKEDDDNLNNLTGEVVVFPAPTGINASPNYRVYVNNKEIFCYSTYRFNDVNPTTYANGRPISPVAFCIFDFKGTVNIVIELINTSKFLQDAMKVMPSMLGIQPVIKDKTIEFKLHNPENITIDPYGNGQNPIHLFTNYPETDIPKPDDPNVVYFGPGLHNVTDIKLKTNQTLYIAGGAFIRCSPPVTVSNHDVAYGISYDLASPAIKIASGVTIKGRGIVSGISAFNERKRFNHISGDNAENVTIKGVTFIDPSKWTAYFYLCNGLTIDGLKILGYFSNSDGICVASSSNCIIRNSFVHSADDCLEIKSWLQRGTNNVIFENCLVWSDVGAPMGLTGEILTDVDNITWRNITVLNFTSLVPSNGYESRGAMTLCCPGNGNVSRILFENITIESISAGKPTIFISNEKRGWSGQPIYTDKPYSNITDVSFKNIKSYYSKKKAYPAEIVFIDKSKSNLIKSVNLENVSINDVMVSDTNDERILNYGNVNYFIK